jgi:hypothetical protein
MLLKELTEPIPTAYIDKKILPWLKWLEKEAHTTQEIGQKLEQELEGIADVDVSNNNPRVASGDMSIDAYYDDELDQEGDEDPIKITLIFGKGDTKIKFDQQGIRNIRNRLVDVIAHEMLHQTQHRRRDFIDGRQGYDTSSHEKEYMSRPDEIEAYALNIADELVRKAGVEGSIELLRMANKTAQFKDKLGNLLSPELFGYFAIFDFDASNPIIKRLLKKTYQFIVQKSSTSD